MAHGVYSSKLLGGKTTQLAAIILHYYQSFRNCSVYFSIHKKKLWLPATRSPKLLFCLPASMASDAAHVLLFMIAKVTCPLLDRTDAFCVYIWKCLSQLSACRRSESIQRFLESFNMVESCTWWRTLLGCSVAFGDSPCHSSTTVTVEFPWVSNFIPLTELTNCRMAVQVIRPEGRVEA